MPTLLKLCTAALTINEIGDDPTLAYRFSDPDGTRNGKSGYSWGRVQYDIENNTNAILRLLYMGFSANDMARLFKQDGAIDDLNIKLAARSDDVDEFDKEHIDDSIQYVVKSCGDQMSSEAFVGLVDYHNQFYITRGGKMHKFINSIRPHRPVTAADVFELKKDTLWWKRNPVDVERRFNNIHEICKGA